MERGSHLRMPMMRNPIGCVAERSADIGTLSDADIAYCSELLERYQSSALVEDPLGAGRTSARLA